MTIRGSDDGFASLHRVLRGSDLQSARAIGRLEGSGSRQSANSPLHRVLGPFRSPELGGRSSRHPQASPAMAGHRQPPHPDPDRRPARSDRLALPLLPPAPKPSQTEEIGSPAGPQRREQHPSRPPTCPTAPPTPLECRQDQSGAPRPPLLQDSPRAHLSVSRLMVGQRPESRRRSGLASVIP